MGLDFLTRQAPYWHALVVVTALLVYFSVTRSLHRRSYPSAVLSWVLTLIFIPYVALPLFLLFGTRKFVRRERVAPALLADARFVEQMWAQRLAASMDVAPAAGYAALNIHENGAAAKRAFIDTVRSAEKTLDVSTFILGHDPTGDEIVRELVARARAGVRVRFLIDGIGRFLDGHPSLHPLSTGGVDVAVFMPILHSPREGRTNLRNHRKLVIADGRRVWCGGRNFAAEYFEGLPGTKVWRDLTIDLEGGAAVLASQCFSRDWAFATKQPATIESAPPEVSTGRSAQLFPSGPDQADDTVLALLVSACFRSNTRIQAVTPYFVPDEALLMALTLAARRGVEVDLLVPVKSNHRLADIARHRALRELAGAGGRVWLCPDMIHAKAVVCDDALAIAGSANLDSRSLFLNYELMFAFYDPADAARFGAWIEGQRADARRYVARRPSLARDLLEGLILWVAFQL